LFWQSAKVISPEYKKKAPMVAKELPVSTKLLKFLFVKIRAFLNDISLGLYVLIL